MLPFRYYSRPVGGVTGRYMAQASYRDMKTAAELYAEVLARLGSTPVTVQSAVEMACRVIIEWTVQGFRIEPLGGLIGSVFGCGGSHPDPDFASTYENMNMDFNSHLGEAGLALAQSLFTAEKLGDQGRVVPVIMRVLNTTTRVENHYSSPGSLQIELENKRGFELLPGTAYHGVFFKSITGTIVEGVVTYTKGQLIIVNVPTGLTGAQELSVAGNIYGSLRTGIYPVPLIT